MSEFRLAVTVKQPSFCDEAELQSYRSMVLSGGEVVSRGLEERVMRARFLFMIHNDQGLVGVAALKSPAERYRRKIFLASGVAESADDYLIELGWIVVHRDFRNQHLSRTLVSAAVESVGSEGVFATSVVSRLAMHRTLLRYGFVRAGEPFRSARRDEDVQLFLWKSTLDDGAQPLE